MKSPTKMMFMMHSCRSEHRQTNRTRAVGVLIGASLLLSAVAAAAQPVPRLEGDFERSSLLIDSVAAGMCYHFETYMARTDRQRARGLMHVPAMPRFTGMIFSFERGQQPTMWMRNTLIPLDMVFLDGDGQVVHISADAVPQSLRTIASPLPARSVLEINGGLAAELGLSAGDRVLHAWFDPGWPEALTEPRP